jgi:hypothetical protein
MDISYGSDVEYEFEFEDLDSDSDWSELPPTELDSETSEDEPEVATSPVRAEVQSSRRRFRLCAKKFFCTWPQCDVPSIEALNNLMEHSGGLVEWAVVAHELHEDGTDHLHALIAFSRERDFSSSSCLDFVTGQHGNYQTVRNLRRVLKYVIKDGDFVYHGEPDPESRLRAMEQHKSKVTDVVAGKIMEGQSVRKVVDEHPGFALMNLHKLKAFRSYVATRPSGSLLPLPQFVPLGLNSSERLIWQWINQNVLQPRTFKQEQLFIAGKTNSGKTSLVLALRNYCRVHFFCMTEEFHDLFEPDETDLVVMDEFRSQKTIQFLNSFLDGTPVTLRVKGAQLLYNHNLPCILLSNYTLRECYSRVYEERPHILDTLKSRLKIINLGDDTLHSLVEKLTPE